MSKNYKTRKKILTCLALAAILIFGLALRFPAAEISPEPITVQASAGDYFNLAYEKTVEFTKPLWENILIFSDQPKDWNQISQNLIHYAKEKPLRAAIVGAGVIWIPFGLFRAFRSKYEEFTESEFEENEEDEDEFEDDEEEYQKNLREFNEDDDTEGELEEDEENVESEVSISALEEDNKKNTKELLENDTETEGNETSFLDEEAREEEEIFEDFESESLEGSEDEFGFLDQDDDDINYGDDDDIDLSAEDDLELNSNMDDFFSESADEEVSISAVKPIDFSSEDSGDDFLKKFENEFASLEAEENNNTESADLSQSISDIEPDKTVINEGTSSEVDQILNASELLSNLVKSAPEATLSHPYEKDDLSPDMMGLIESSAVKVPTSSSTSSPDDIDLTAIDDEDELDQTLKDLQAEMEQTIQEISAQIHSESVEDIPSSLEPEGSSLFEVSNDKSLSPELTSLPNISELKEKEDELTIEEILKQAKKETQEVDDGPTIDEILKKAEEEAEKDIKELLPESNVFLQEEILSQEEEAIDEAPSVVKDVFSDAIGSDTFQETLTNEVELTETSISSEAYNVDLNIESVETPQVFEEPTFTISEFNKETPVSFQGLTEESTEEYDPLIPALDAATKKEPPKPSDKPPIDPVKANSYIKSLGSFQRNLEKRLNTLRYFPSIVESPKTVPVIKEHELETEDFTPQEAEINIDFDHIEEDSPEKKYSLELMESFILLENQK
jgi:hypothetical protein